LDHFARLHQPIAIDACGSSSAKVTPKLYEDNDLDAIPWRGPLAANTVAGTVGGWAFALSVNARLTSRPLPVEQLFEEARHYADNGAVVSKSQAELTGRNWAMVRFRSSGIAHLRSNMRK
jgi:oxamate amidohydrolase